MDLAPGLSITVLRSPALSSMSDNKTHAAVVLEHSQVLVKRTRKSDEEAQLNESK